MSLSRAGSAAPKGIQRGCSGEPHGGTRYGRGEPRAEPPARPCPWAAAAAPVGTAFPPKRFSLYRLGWKHQPAGRVCSKPRGKHCPRSPVPTAHPDLPHTCAGKQFTRHVQMLSGRGLLWFQIRKLSQMNDILRFGQAMVFNHIFVVLSSPKRAPEAQSRNRISDSLIWHKETLHL